MAVQLRKTMQQSGYWGAVWITPKESMAADISVVANILESDGYIVRVDVRAIDAANRVWIDKRYGLETAAAAYGQRCPGIDPSARS